MQVGSYSHTDGMIAMKSLNNLLELMKHTITLSFIFGNSIGI